jgi:ribosomal protein L1
MRLAEQLDWKGLIRRVLTGGIIEDVIKSIKNMKKCCWRRSKKKPFGKI